MAGPADLMREIHRLRRHARDLREQLDRIPRQVKAQENRVAAAEAALNDGREAIKRLKATVHEKEVAFRAAQSKIAKRNAQLEDALKGAAAAKEIDAFRKEIAHEQESAVNLENEAFAAMTEGEERTAGLPALEAALKKARDDYAAFEQSIGERREGLATELAATEAKLAETETGVPAPLRTQYDRIVNAMGPDGFAALQGRSCSACHTGVTAQNFISLQAGSFVLCKSCGRILYLPE